MIKLTARAMPAAFLLLFLVLNFNSSLFAQQPEPAPPEAPPAESISADPDPAEDQAITRRLENIYAEIAGLNNVKVEVEAGVVTLSGVLAGAEQVSNAQNLANAVAGVVAVENQLQRDNQLDSQLKLLFEKMRDIGQSIIVGLPLLIFALVIIFSFWWLGGFLTRHIHFPKVWTPNIFVEDLARLSLRLLLLLIGLVIAAQLLDATALLASVVGGVGVFGLALGFAIRDTVENFIASILLSIRQPFNAHDHVVIEDDIEGKIVRLTSRATILMDFDGNKIRVPNSTVYKAKIKNYTANPQRRFSFEVGIDTAVYPPDAQALAVAALAEIDAILSDPAPQCQVTALGDSNVVLLVNAWIDQRVSDFNKTKSVAMSTVKRAFEEADVDMPEPIYRLRIDETKALLNLRPVSVGDPARSLQSEKSGSPVSTSAAAKAKERKAERPKADESSSVPVDKRSELEKTAQSQEIIADTGLDDSITRQVEEEIQEGEDLLTRRAPKE